MKDSIRHEASESSFTRLRKRMHQLRERGYFRYMKHSILWILTIYAFLVLLLVLAGKYLVDFNALLGGIVERLPDRFVWMLFFFSESFTGMIPVDLFVIWTQKFEHPLPWLGILGLLSYAGGIISYGIGTWISRGRRVRIFTERKLDRYIVLTRKWGGAFIIIAALFPFTPFSLVIMALALLRYPFRYFLLFGLFRLFRFILQGIFFFDLLKVHQWIA